MRKNGRKRKWVSDYWGKTKKLIEETEEALKDYFGEDDFEFIIDNIRVFLLIYYYHVKKHALRQKDIDLIEDFLEELKSRVEY